MSKVTGTVESEATPNWSKIELSFKSNWYEDEEPNRAITIGQRAWLSCFVPSYENGQNTLDQVDLINTTKFDPRVSKHTVFGFITAS